MANTKTILFGRRSACPFLPKRCHDEAARHFGLPLPSLAKFGYGAVQHNQLSLSPVSLIWSGIVSSSLQRNPTGILPYMLDR